MESDHDTSRLCLVLPTNSIGEDLLLLIFKRLPTKTLGRFRVVCKWWKALISTSFFINVHHSFISSTTPPNMKPYLYVSRISYTLYNPQKDLIENFSEEVHFPFQFRNPEARYQGDPYYFQFVDVIHGVVCISSSLDSWYDSTILWNPTIRKYISLPWLPVPDTYDEVSNNCIAIGFGYDSSKKDFKVVRIWIPDLSTSLVPMYEVYSVKEGIWRVGVADMNLKSYGFYAKDTGCFVNGTTHWPIREDLESNYVVLMFDCVCEEISTMDLPNEIFNVDDPPPFEHNFVEVVEYRGMLSVLVLSDSVGESRIDLWVMKKYGVISTWNKLYRLYSGYPYGNAVVVYEPSFVNLAPNGPRQWIKSIAFKNLYELLDHHVYEESVFLMDDANAQSYSKDEIVLF